MCRHHQSAGAGRGRGIRRGLIVAEFLGLRELLYVASDRSDDRSKAASVPFRPEQRAHCDLKSLFSTCTDTSTILKEYQLLRLFQMKLLWFFINYINENRCEPPRFITDVKVSPTCFTRPVSLLLKFTQLPSLLFLGLKISPTKISGTDDARN